MINANLHRRYAWMMVACAFAATGCAGQMQPTGTLWSTNGAAQLTPREAVQTTRQETGFVDKTRTWSRASNGQSFVSDNKVVVLHRLGAVGETVDYTTNANGPTTHGDTVYSLNSQTTDLLNSTRFATGASHQTFRSTLVGNWGARSAWNWSNNSNEPDWAGQTAVYEYATMPFGAVEHKSRANPLRDNYEPRHVHITYRCTDSKDGKTAAAYYDLTVHYAIDGWTKSGPAVPETALSYGTSDPGIAGGDVRFEMPGPAVSWNVLGITIAPSPPKQSWFQPGSYAQFLADCRKGNVAPEVKNLLKTRNDADIFKGMYGTLWFDVTVSQSVWKQTVTGSSWNQHGYAGQVSRSYTYPGTYNYSFYWFINNASISKNLVIKKT